MASAASQVETVVIGAGVVGLAVARALAQRGEEVLLVDRASRIGSETSSRNSEVVHAGLYYPKGSLKAQFCVQGRRMLYDYCEARSIPFNKCGKLVVAADKDQVHSTLPGLQQLAQQNGVTDTQLLSSDQVKAMEPQVQALGALWSPSTGIVDSHSLMFSLLADAEDHGTTLALHSNVQDAKIEDDSSILLDIEGLWLSCGSVVNAAGLWADKIAARMHSSTAWQPPKQYYAKGTYFQLHGPSPFLHLIYPVPDPAGGLGVHATLDLNGRVKFGPNVEWLDIETDPDEIDFTPDETQAQSFYKSIRQYWSELPDGALVPDYTGVRPKLSHPDLVETMSFHDFAVMGEETHGVPGLVHLFGIESPGLTSSMAIAEYVADKL